MSLQRLNRWSLFTDHHLQLQLKLLLPFDLLTFVAHQNYSQETLVYMSVESPSLSPNTVLNTKFYYSVLMANHHNRSRDKTHCC